MFDITPFLVPDDPWLATEDPETVRRLYAEKYRVAALLQPRSILEIGVRAGYSAAAFLSAAPTCTYLGIDADIDDHGGWPGSFARARDMLRRYFGERAELFSLNTQHLDSLPCNAVDLVHIDGDHSYHGCLHDLELAGRIARWILVDDIDWHKTVRAAATSFVQRGGFRAVELSTVRGDLLIEMKPSRMTYSHGGDTGDLIYALATVKTLGGGSLRLVKTNYVREPFTPSKVETLRPLLEAQPYITGVEYGETPIGLNLDDWRKQYRNELNLCDMVASAFGVPHYPREQPWIFCQDPNPVAPVVIARSSRYQGNHFPWQCVRQRYGSDLVFVGLPEEHAAWQDEFGPVRYQPTADWWELSRVLAGARIFCGNQSAPLALAMALCVPQIVQEVCLGISNCHFERPGVVYGRGADVSLPKLEL